METTWTYVLVVFCTGTTHYILLLAVIPLLVPAVSTGILANFVWWRVYPGFVSAYLTGMRL